MARAERHFLRCVDIGARAFDIDFAEIRQRHDGAFIHRCGGKQKL